MVRAIIPIKFILKAVTKTAETVRLSESLRMVRADTRHLKLIPSEPIGRTFASSPIRDCRVSA